MSFTEGKRRPSGPKTAASAYRGFFRDAPVGMCRISRHGAIVEANRALAAMLGYADPVDLVGRSLLVLVSEPELVERLLRPSNGDERRSAEVNLLRRDGSTAPVRLRAHTVGKAGSGFELFVEDRAAWRRMIDSLREANQRAHKLFQTTLDAVAINTLDEGKYLEVNDEFVRLTGYTREDVIGRTSAELGIWCDPDQLRRLLRDITREGIVRNLEGDFRAKDGSIIPALLSAERVTIGSRPCILSISRDIRDRRWAEEALRESEHRYRTLFEESNDVIFLTDPNGMLIDVNPAGVALLGCRNKEEVIGTGNAIVFYEQPEMQQRLLEELRRQGQLKNVELDLRRKDGARVKTILNATALHDVRGNVVAVLGSVRDITDRARLEQQLLQSQRMEAVGRLAGGVAHDFNNFLTVIRASAGLALLDLPVGHPLRPRLEEIDEAAERSAELTSQLLAFARRRVVSPQVLDLNRLIRNLEKMLRRLLGEDIDLVTELAPNLWPIRADGAQLEQVVMNLAVNARDAMPAGGTLRLETANTAFAADGVDAGVLPGEYVRLTVTDTGSGMSDEIRAHIFEPFFTTKETGRGTGLGLATCYGIVTQGGGRIDAESEPGRGATFRILLPRVFDAAEPASKAESVPRTRGRETVLLLEDEPLVRRLTAEVLRDRGYVVLEAAAAADAITLAEQGESLRLLVSDVVLPGRSGPDAAERIRELVPGIKVLFISGHSYDSRLASQLERSGAAFLQKPFTPDALAENVRRLLDAND